MVRVVFASDSFKGSLSSVEVGRVLEDACRRELGACEATIVPMADGGEGTVDALVEATGGRLIATQTTDPLGRALTATWGMLGSGQAAIEMAAASGLPLLLPGELNPLLTSTYGTGLLIKAALDAGATQITLAIGGSATNDGGMGVLAALGAVFYDEKNTPLEPCGAALGQVARVDLSGLDPRLADTHLTLMCDVDNPLLGEHGCAHVFAAQKGATPKMIEQLEAGMAVYADALEAASGRAVRSMPGAGAAGGLGFGVAAALGATMQQGIQAVLDLVHFDELLATADLVVTGEGRMDAQTAHGKVAQGVAARANAHNVPCVAVVGSLARDVDPHALGLAAVVDCVPGPMEITEVMDQASRHLEMAGERLFALIGVGARLGQSHHLKPGAASD